MHSSAKWRCVLNLASSFWCCGIFLIIWDKSRMFLPSLWMRFSWLNFFNFFVTFWDTMAMCWCLISTQRSSFSSRSTSFVTPSDASYLRTVVVVTWIKDNAFFLFDCTCRHRSRWATSRRSWPGRLAHEEESTRCRIHGQGSGAAIWLSPSPRPWSAHPPCTRPASAGPSGRIRHCSRSHCNKEHVKYERAYKNNSTNHYTRAVFKPGQSFSYLAHRIFWASEWRHTPSLQWKRPCARPRSVSAWTKVRLVPSLLIFGHTIESGKGLQLFILDLTTVGIKSKSTTTSTATTTSTTTITTLVQTLMDPMEMPSK